MFTQEVQSSSVTIVSLSFSQIWACMQFEQPQSLLLTRFTIPSIEMLTSAGFLYISPPPRFEATSDTCSV